jgi:PPOX class probable F420-dependent enzyme
MAEFDAAAMFAESPVAMLATSGRNGAPHIVPVVFAVHGDMVYTAVDAKRKSTQRLRRLVNNDWAALWWVRADGVAAIHYSGDEMANGYSLLRRKYLQYQRIALDGPVVTVEVRRWSSWQA